MVWFPTQVTSNAVPVSSAAVGNGAASEAGDGVATVLCLLASVFRLRPELIIDDRLRDDSLAEFLEVCSEPVAHLEPDISLTSARHLQTASGLTFLPLF